MAADAAAALVVIETEGARTAAGTQAAIATEVAAISVARAGLAAPGARADSELGVADAATALHVGDAGGGIADAARAVAAGSTATLRVCVAGVARLNAGARATNAETVTTIVAGCARTEPATATLSITDGTETVKA